MPTQRYSIETEGEQAWLVIRIPISTLPEMVNVRAGELADDIRHQRLSVRENQVYDLIMARKSNKEIANELHIEIRTVKFHVSEVLRKMGVSSRAHLWFMNEG